MGFWSTLGRIGAGIGAGVAAPLTGGASLMALPTILGGAAGALGSIGNVASGAAQGSANQRGSDAQLQALYQQLAMQAARDQANFGQQGARDAFQSQLDAAKFGATEQQRGAKNQILAQLLGNAQDINISGLPERFAGKVPTITGGLRPSALGGNREALMAALTQKGPEMPTFTPGAPYEPPAALTPPRAGTGEKVLGGIGLGSSLLGALGGLFNRPQSSGIFANVPTGLTAPRRA